MFFINNMQVNFLSDNINFTSRNSAIRFADDIARRVNTEFPRLSSTKVEGMKNSVKFSDYTLDLFARIIRMRHKIVYNNKEKCGDLISKWAVLADTIKKVKLGNCQESAMLGEVTARVNDVKNCKLVALIPKDGKFGETFDHAVLYVDSKKPYIIDPWLGFADYVPNAIKRFQKEFSHHFDFQKYKTEKIDFECLGAKHILEPKDVQRLKELFPELIIKKGLN